jgi:hypothetical protein
VFKVNKILIGLLSTLLLAACSGDFVHSTVDSTPLPLGEATEQLTEESTLCLEGLRPSEADLFCNQKGYERSLDSKCVLGVATVNCV